MPHLCPTKFSWPFKIEYCLFGNLDSTQEMSRLNCQFWISYGIKFCFSLTILPLYWMKTFCFTLTTFQAPSQNWEKRLLDSSRLCVWPSDCREQLGSHWMAFHEIGIWVFFENPRKSCRLWDNVGKYGTARQTTDKKICIWCVRFFCWITTSTVTRRGLCSTFCSSKATMFRWKRLNATSLCRLHYQSS